MAKWRLLALAVALFVFVLSGCSALSGRGGSTKDEATQPAQATQAGESQTKAKEKPTAKEKRQLPFTLDLDLQQSHPNGSLVTLKKLTADDKYINIDIEVIQALGNSTKLNPSSSGADGKPQLVDDTGFAYQYFGPNDELKINEGTIATGKIVFLGRLKDEANKLILEFNNPYEKDKNNKNTKNPYYKFEIDLKNK